MKALVITQANQYPYVAEVSKPEKLKDNVVVQVKSAALNHRDIWIVRDKYPGVNYPVILGSDASGVFQNREVIIQPGMSWGNSQLVQSGRYHILGSPSPGTFAEYVSVSEFQLYDKPLHLNFTQTAALPLAGLTAFRVLFRRCQAKAGESLLITGIGGGVALFCCQFAIAAGLNVFVTSGEDWKIEKAKELGVIAGANYRKENWVSELSQFSNGFDIVIDSAAGEGFSQLLKLCRPGARIGIYGAGQGEISKLSPQLIFWRQLSIVGSTMGSDEDFAQMIEFVNRHKIIPVIDTVYSLSDAEKAFRRLETGKQFGKVVLAVS